MNTCAGACKNSKLLLTTVPINYWRTFISDDLAGITVKAESRLSSIIKPGWVTVETAVLDLIGNIQLKISKPFHDFSGDIIAPPFLKKLQGCPSWGCLEKKPLSQSLPGMLSLNGVGLPSSSRIFFTTCTNSFRVQPYRILAM
ncbi:hypothetical protein DPMN_118067 [Dreissena polymorpha]|uniref:Uncharacterized protein n=1 Tax=Dreissena polymorpha TaxID=45954 RepID=A0A9D4GG75_DREPO|nr:hypothetical protein DPMN_118067 [Dreissena polymorpha]